MAGIAKVPQVNKPAEPYKPEVVRREVINEVVDTRYHSLKSLMTFTGGQSMEVTAYLQRLFPGSEPMPFQFEESGTLQQYLRVKRMIIKVQSGLSRNPNTTDGEMELTGVGITMPGIVPNYGDMFITDIGDGRAGLFAITNVEPLSQYRDTAYQIEYGLVDYVTPLIQSAIDKKVVEKAYYDLEYARTGKNPIVAAEDYNAREDLASIEQSLTRYFFSHFYDREFRSFTIPNQDRASYDPYFTRFVDKLIDYDRRPTNDYLNVFDESREGDSKPVTLWDMLVTQDPTQFNYVDKEFVLAQTIQFKSASSLYGSITYSGYIQTVYPKKYIVNGISLKSMDTSNNNVSTLLPTDVQLYDTYVLSKAFYEQRTADMNKLELFTHKVITGKPLEFSVVKDMCDEFYKASELVQFYIYPLLVVICRTARYRL